jgi:formate C-acetyltransferase
MGTAATALILDGQATGDGMTERIRFLHETKHDFYDAGEIPRRDRVYRASFAKNAADSIPLKFAKAYGEFLAEKKILLRREDVLAGYPYKYSYGTTLPKVWREDFDPAGQEGPPPFAFSDCSIEAESAKRYFGFAEDSAEARTLDFFVSGVEHWVYKHMPAGHIISDYERILGRGYAALREDAERALAQPHTEAEKDYIRAALIASDAVSNYIQRYAEEARRLAAETEDAVQKAQLRKIAAATAQIADGPATDFFEAVQLVWLNYEALYAESMPNCISAGRLDKYLAPYYRKDIEDGRLTHEEAAETIDAFWLKFAVNRTSFQNVTLGGYDTDGRYIANPVTSLVLSATRKFKDEQPLISLRYSYKDVTDAFWEEIVATLLTGTGFPPLFNDEVFIPAKEKQGLSHEDAVGYAMVGCVEVTGTGNDYSDTEAVRLNIPLVLEFLFTGGVQRLTGKTFPLAAPRGLESIDSFDDFYAWFKAELKHYFLKGIEAAEAIRAMWGHCYPNPFLSFTVRDCVKKGRDVASGGAVYNNSTLNGAGFANAANALYAIKRSVFEDGIVTLEELGAALAADFAGYEDLQKALLSYPKYGNDDDDVDQFVGEIVDVMHELTDDRENSVGGRYGIGIYTVSDHANMGEATGALPDGRRAGVSLSNGSGPSQGTDTEGPTAVINSVLKAKVDTVANGQVLDLKFNPSFLKRPSHQTALRHLVNAYFRRGGGQIQFNIIGKDTLVAAQNDPAQYKDLVVRVSGFSAHFCNLTRATQDEIIARTEHDRL